MPITIPEAIRGATVEVPTLSGTKRIRVPAGTQHGTVQRLRGEGPAKLNGKGRGDIHYRLTIDVPRSLNNEQKQAVDDLAVRDERQSRASGCSGRGGRRWHGTRPAATATLDPRRGVYMISVAAELAGMHPQTLRIYESRGLITPKRSRGNTRLYSQDDVERLRRIQELTSQMGMNLAGVERVFELEKEIERMSERMRRIQRQAEQMEREMRAEMERVRRSFKFELVPYAAAGESPHAHGPGRREDPD